MEDDADDITPPRPSELSSSLAVRAANGVWKATGRRRRPTRGLRQLLPTPSVARLERLAKRDAACMIARACGAQ